MQSTAGYRFRAAIVGTFAALALVLAMIGVFGVLAYSVQQRQREFGVRVALGATGPSILWLVVERAGRLIAVGGASAWCWRSCWAGRSRHSCSVCHPSTR